MLKKAQLPLLLLYLMISNVFVNESFAKIQNLSLGHLSVEDGLSQGTITNILQDDYGFIWLGTDSGINLYDGYTIKSLPGPDNKFSEYTVQQLMQDSKGLIWINLVSKGLYTFNPKNNEYRLVLPHNFDKTNNYIIQALETENDKFWVATSKSIGMYDKATDTFQSILDLSKELASKNNIYKITQHKNVMYIATREGVFAYHIVLDKWRKLPPMTAISSNSSNFNSEQSIKTYDLYVSDKQDLYIATNDGVFSLFIGHIDDYIKNNVILPNYELHIEHVSVWTLFADKKMLYIGSDKGLSVIDLRSKNSELLFGYSDNYENVNDNNLISIYKDNDGVFWLGSNSTGVYLWDPETEYIKNYKYVKGKKSSLSSNQVWNIHQQNKAQNVLWVATINGLNLVNLATEHVEHFIVNNNLQDLYSKSYIYQIFEDDLQRLWLNTADGLYLFDIHTKSLIDLPYNEKINNILKKEQYTVFFEDNSLWVFNEEGVFRLDISVGKLEKVSQITEKISVGNLYNMLGFLPDKKSLLLSTNDSLWAYNISTKALTQLYRHPDVLATETNSFGSFTIDKNNVLWLTFSTRGLVGIDADTFEFKYFIHRGNSIIDNNLYGVMADIDGDIWVSSHSGLFLLNSDTLHIRNYSMSDGLPAMEFNDYAFTQLVDNRMVYGSMEGISIFSPSQLKNKDSAENFVVKISNISTLSRELDTPLIVNDNYEVNLGYDDIGIQIDVSTFSFTYTNSTLFDYELFGKNNIHYPETNNNSVAFPSLDSGSYVLKIRAKSPLTGKYSQAKTLNINVRYAPWNSPLAYAFYTMLILVISTFWYLKRRSQRLELLHVHEEVKFRENRLQLALRGSNSEVWDWQAEGDLLFGKRISEELGYEKYALSYSFKEHIALIHLEDQENFIVKWQAFIARANLNENFSFTYRLKSIEGNWEWYKDLGKVVSLDEHGSPNRVTGSYTNITQSRADEERAQYYGDAFKQTKDWVLIVDENLSRATANKSLRKVLGWPEEEFLLKNNRLGLRKDRHKFFTNLLSTLKEGEHWRGEELFKTREGVEYHVILNINVSRNSRNNTLHYVCIFTDITAQKTAEKELRYLANYDHLTDLPNRSLLLERIKHAMDYSVRKNTSIALFFIDLDKFKQVNDSLGHNAGDILLKELTQRLSKILRADDTLARIGGDEFVVLLESFTSNAQLIHIAQKIITVVGEPVQIRKNVVSVGASIGIALSPEDAGSSDDLLRNADVAMYHAKNLGRNTFQFFTQRMNFEATERLKKESAIKQALIDDEFINFYQPIIDTKSGKVVGLELLLRWQSKEGLVQPIDFIGVSEELGLIIQMTESAINRGLADIKSWFAINPDLYLSVNLSTQHLIKNTLPSFISSMLLHHDVLPSALKLEITENALISEPQKAIQIMTELSDLGVLLAMDDFGTGFSSLAYLKKLPLDIIKIDRTFVAGINKETADEAIIDSTIVLAKRLGMHCIAEGVETKQQLEYIQRQGCNTIQGYFFSKPEASDYISQYLHDNAINTQNLRNDSN